MNFWNDLKYRLVMAAFNPAVFNTSLTPEQIPHYNTWRQELSKDNPQLNNDHDYDLQGAFLAGTKPDPRAHFPDTFKKPNHITFSDQSKYHSPETPGGQWTKLGPHPTIPGEHTWSFKPSKTNLQMHGPEKLQNYFNEHEKGNSLEL